MKKSKTLGFKIGIVFASFLFVVLVLCALTTYLGQMSIYKKKKKKNIRGVGEFLASLMALEGEDFIVYQDYYLDHFADVNIPIDASEYISYRRSFENRLAESHPGKTLGVDLTFDEMDEDLKNAFLIYKHLYWLLTFEQARADFDLPYSYYLVMDDENHNVIYMIDGERNSRAGHLEFIRENPEYQPYHHEQGDEAEFMYLCDEYHNDPEKYPVEWAAWQNSGEQAGYQVWNNEWGNTYAYYTPLIINGQKLGLVGTEVEIADVNTQILRNTVRQFVVIALILTAGLVVVIYFINRHYISKIVRLEANVKDYTLTKDPEVAEDIRRNIHGEDEITSLSEGVIHMIYEIRDYIENLMRTTQELDQANDRVDKISHMALKDGLTGVGNQYEYKNAAAKLDQEIQNGWNEFGIAMIDLNFLKHINDTYGHEQGNIAIKTISDVICRTFKHSPVFRIGGDEFVVILKNEDYENRDSLLKKFTWKLDVMQQDSSLEPWEKVSAAIGIAVFDPETDTGAESVFKRADEQMYACKRAMKAERVS